MQIFKIDNNKLNELNEKAFKLEKEIQTIKKNGPIVYNIDKNLFIFVSVLSLLINVMK